MPTGSANVANNRESDFMSGSLLSKKPFQYGARIANINAPPARAALIDMKCAALLIRF
jgi:hypothetical protein